MQPLGPKHDLLIRLCKSLSFKSDLTCYETVPVLFYSLSLSPFVCSNGDKLNTMILHQAKADKGWWLR